VALSGEGAPTLDGGPFGASRWWPAPRVRPLRGVGCHRSVCDCGCQCATMAYMPYDPELTERIVIRVTTSDKQWLESKTEIDGRSMSSVVRQVIARARKSEKVGQ